MLDPLPVEMSAGALEKIYPDLGTGSKQRPLSELYALLEELNDALVANIGTGTPYNPAGNTIHDFKWAHVRYMNTTQLCAESNVTRKVLSSDASLIPNPEGKFQGYMVELVNLSKL